MNTEILSPGVLQVRNLTKAIGDSYKRVNENFTDHKSFRMNFDSFSSYND